MGGVFMEYTFAVRILLEVFQPKTLQNIVLTDWVDTLSV